MEINELITKINKSAEDLDLVSTRKYIEENLKLLNENKIYLKGNARELLVFLTDNSNSGEQPLTKNEIASIRVINSYATDFNFSGLKLVIKDKSQLLLRKEVLQYLNSDAKIFLHSMGAIKNE